MDQNEVALKFNVDNKSLSELNDQLVKLTDQWKNVALGSESFKTLKVEIDSLTKVIKNNGAEFDNTGNLINKLQGNIFSLVPGLSSMKDGFIALNTTFLELAANPILGIFIAISATLVVLFEAFKNTKTGARELKVVMAEFGEVSYQIKEVLAQIAQVIAEVLLPIIQFLLQSLSSIIDYVIKNKTMFFELGVVIGATTLILNASAIATGALAIAEGVATVATGAFTFATAALAVALNATGIPEVVILIAALVAGIVIAYNKSETFRGVIEGIISIFQKWVIVSKLVLDVLGGIGTAISGIINRDLSEIKRGLDQAADAGVKIGKTFQEGFQKGVDEVKNGNKNTSTNKVDDATNAQNNYNKAIKESKQLEVDHTEVIAKKDKAVMMVKTNQIGATEALKQAEEAEKSYGVKILANKQNILDSAKEFAKLRPEDAAASANARQAQIDYNETLSEGYRIETKLGLLSKRNKSTLAKEETAAQKKLKKDTNEKLLKIKDDLKNQIKDLKKFSKEKIDIENKYDDIEIEFYNKNYKALGITEEQKRAKIIEINEKKIKDNSEYNKHKLEDDKKDLLAKDQININEADSDSAKLAATLKKIKDENEEELKDTNLTEMQKNLIISNYDIKKNKLIEDDAIKQQEIKIKANDLNIKKIDDEEKLDTKSIKNKVLLYDKLIDLEHQKIKAQIILEDSKYELDKIKAEDNDDELEIIEKQHNDNILKIKKDGAVESKNLNDSETDARLDNMNKVASASTQLSELFGQQTVAAKGLAIASALINTYTGVTKALSLGVEGIIPAVTIVAAGLESVQKIISTKVAGSSGGGGGGSAPTIKSFTGPQMFGMGGQKIDNLKDYQNQKVYVTESDITKTQNRVKTIQNSAILGH